MTYTKIKGYENYGISIDGKVYSYKRNKIRKTVIQKKNHTSYERVVLFKDGKNKKFFIHRLIAIAYIPNPLNKPHINHIDNNGLNNCISNLEWVTHKENVNHSTNQKRMGMDRDHLVKITLDKRERSENRLRKILSNNIKKFEYKHNDTGHPFTLLTLTCPKCKEERTVIANLNYLTKSKGLCRRCARVK